MPKVGEGGFPNLKIAEKYAFSDCERLTIAIPYDIERIENGAFKFVIKLMKSKKIWNNWERRTSST